MNIYKLVAIAFLAVLTIMGAIADDDVYGFLAGENVYSRVKKDAVEENKEVFLRYEKQNSSKIIVACVRNSLEYSVEAQWNLKISSKHEAETAAQNLCTRSGAFGNVLLGYKINKEIRF